MSGRSAGPTTARLEAEAPDPDRHLEFAARQFSDPRVVPWHWPERPGDAGGPRSREQAREMLDRHARQLVEHGYTPWWWREHSSGELVGQAGLNRDQVEGEPVVEVGWSISPRRWGEGLATEAAIASIAWGFETAGLEEIVAFTMPHNAASRRVMEKAGLSYERDYERVGLPHVLYRVRRGVGALPMPVQPIAT